MPQIGIWEILAIFLVIVVLFGPKKLPEIGRAVGDAIREFKKSLKGIDEDKKDGTK